MPYSWILPRPSSRTSVEASSLIGAAYTANLCMLAVFGLHRLELVRCFRWRAQGSSPGRQAGPASGELPALTVQLPLYDELAVAARLIRAAGALDYPRELLEIQVLDDSTDGTRAVVDAEVARLVEQGLEARVLRRADRHGFKAGALAHGLERARGELVCIFDADFLPPPDFLRRLVPRFADPGIGMVQARWSHLNREDSALTRAQATLLDGHFVIEHTVRSERGLFFNFNGTAGIWRRAAIEDAGGWQHDTLTEDLDLSYRAQLAGWRFSYAPLVAAPAELPPDIAAFKGQQHRWAKGSAQVLRKLGGPILASERPARVRLEALLHLAGNVGYPCVLLLALLLPLAVRFPGQVPAAVHLALFLACTVSVWVFYGTGQRALGRGPLQALGDTFLALVLGIGMSVAQTRAVLEGLGARTGEFVRTPKRGPRGAPAAYRSALRGAPGLELVPAAWLAWGAAGALARGAFVALPFLLLFLAGFLWVGGLSLALWWRERGPGARAAEQEGAAGLGAGR